MRTKFLGTCTLVLALAMGLTACGGSDDTSDPATEPKPEASTSTTAAGAGSASTTDVPATESTDTTAPTDTRDSADTTASDETTASPESPDSTGTTAQGATPPPDAVNLVDAPDKAGATDVCAKLETDVVARVLGSPKAKALTTKTLNADLPASQCTYELDSGLHATVAFTTSGEFDAAAANPQFTEVTELPTGFAGKNVFAVRNETGGVVVQVAGPAGLDRSKMAALAGYARSLTQE